MKHLFTINPTSFKVVHELPNAWSNAHYLKLLELMDYGDTTGLDPKEVREMCLLSISDNEPEEAAKIILEYIFQDRLNSGQIDNISNEMVEEKIWEEYAELSMHEEFFNVTQILYDAYNGKFPHPEAVVMQIEFTAKNPKSIAVFESDIEANLIRLITSGMPENTLIKRLFDDQLNGEDFPDAKDIIWQYKKTATEGDKLVYEIISSTYWFHDFKYIEEYEAELKVLEE
tara:strand:- start:7293 stop:7979 length:687 start_codon:yes stop_codon:yes gene_type:complete